LQHLKLTVRNWSVLKLTDIVIWYINCLLLAVYLGTFHDTNVMLMKVKCHI